MNRLHAAVSMLLVAAGATAAQAEDFGRDRDHDRGHHVYVMSNAAGPNTVVVLKRGVAGTLEKEQVVETGGLGSGKGTASDHDPLGSQNAMWLSTDGRFLFVANAGSSQLSTFEIDDDGRLKLVDVVDSGGTYPVSITQLGHKLFVMNTGGSEANVAVFHIGWEGHLRALHGAERGLGVTVDTVGNQPNEFHAPGQLGFTPDGRWLVVTVKNLGVLGSIQVFGVNDDGTLARHSVTTASTNPLPFGFNFDRRGHLLVTEAFGGAVSSYSVNQDGTLTTISSSVANAQTGTCWIELDGNIAYTSNTDANTLSAYVVNSKGQLSLLNGQQVIEKTPGDIPLDFKISSDKRFLYVSNPGSGSVSTFAIHHDGSLSLADKITLFAPLSGQQGVAAD